MIRALNAASSGMVAQSIKQDIIANNLANAQTAGFKRQRVTESSFAQTLRVQALSLADRTRLSYPDSPANPVVVSAQGGLDASQGVLQSTGNELDFAIQGPGAFEVSTASGTVLTRGGSFRLGPNRELVTVDGGVLQGRSGPVQIPKGDWQLGADGAILVKGAEVDRLKIAGAKAGDTQVLQGCIEASNVNSITEMVDMIANMRAYEANQRVISSVDQTLDKLINEAGKV